MGTNVFSVASLLNISGGSLLQISGIIIPLPDENTVELELIGRTLTSVVDLVFLGTKAGANAVKKLLTGPVVDFGFEVFCRSGNDERNLELLLLTLLGALESPFRSIVGSLRAPIGMRGTVHLSINFPELRFPVSFSWYPMMMGHWLNSLDMNSNSGGCCA
jgi:hypothetical protein